MLRLAKKLAAPVGVTGIALAGFLIYDDQRANKRHNEPYRSTVPEPVAPPRPRSEILKSLASGQEYDVLVIGGGATGTGVAWDAVTRGLKTALVERDDFASATSSRSTKLVHGGVRYLEKAFWQADIDQFLLVKEALAERKLFVEMAPHLAFPLPIMIPIYKWWQLPYYYAGVKAYDAIAGSANLESSYMLTRSRALQLFPMLNDAELKGAIVYYDGSHNDSRTNASVAVTAIEKGADVLNHVEVVGLVKDDQGKIVGAEVVDKEDATSPNKETFVIRAKAVVNATGPFTDIIRKMDNQNAQGIAVASSGVHIVLPGWYCPKNMGLLDPATSDGRVVFFLPWQGSTIAGTTDRPANIEANPVPSEEDISFVLNEVRHYIDGKIQVDRNDVRAAWSGIRPLVKDPNTTDTQNVVRNHAIHISDGGLVTIAGGKWTTFREMAEETVDTVVKHFGFNAGPCQTKAGAKVVGAEGYTPLQYLDLIRYFGIEPVAARHLTENYGSRAFDVARLCTPTAFDSEGRVVQRNARLNPLYPFLDGEVQYAMRYEYATSAIDVLARRTRLAFLDAQAAKESLTNVIDIMGQHFGWDMARQQHEYSASLEYLVAMGLRDQPLATVGASPAVGTNSATTAVVPALRAPGADPGEARSQ